MTTGPVGPSIKTIKEPAMDIKVVNECDVVVLGGGPGGFAAALAAARNGAKTVMVERYGHLGGMASGGLVTIVPNMSGFDGQQYINGICGEWINKMDAIGAVCYPKDEELGLHDPNVVKYWQNRGHFFIRENTVIKSVFIDAEMCKVILNDMFEQAGIKTYLHSWGTKAIVDKNEVQGIIFESKSGRQAILAKVIIDSTGDGDLLPSAGAEFEDDIDPKLRIAALSLCFWIGGVNLQKAEDFKYTYPDKFAAQQKELLALGGYAGYLRSNIKHQESVVWVHNRHVVSSQMDVEQLTATEFEGRKKMMRTLEYRRKNTPGFEHAFIVVSDPQLGTRGGRRVLGEYRLTAKHQDSDEIYPDTIAVLPDLDRGKASLAHPLQYVPYRSMVPIKVENLLVACRAFSSDGVYNTNFNIIPHCVAYGEAAGTAAAIAIKEGVKVRKVNYEQLQDKLIKQGVTLPGAR